jgi:hypothetical protein
MLSVYFSNTTFAQDEKEKATKLKKDRTVD